MRTGRTKIIPQSGEKTYFHWLENIEPWCISRQLWWGHQIPVWYGLTCRAPGFTDDEGDEALDEVEILSRPRRRRLCRARGACTIAPPILQAVAEKFRDDLAALPHPLNHARVVEVADRARRGRRRLPHRWPTTTVARIRRS